MDPTIWIEYLAYGLAAQLEEVKTQGSAVIPADGLARSHRLTVRQSAVLADIL